jgi:hypothetical protein
MIAVPLHEAVYSGLLGPLADEVGNVDGVEIAGGDEALDGGEIDVLGVAEILFRPAKLFDSVVGGRASAGRFGTDDEVLAIGLVPDGNNIDASVGGLHTSLQLCFA